METFDKTQLEYELTWCEIEREHEPYMDTKRRMERADRLDANLNSLWKPHEKRMDNLLEELKERMGALAVNEAVA